MNKVDKDELVTVSPLGDTSNLASYERRSYYDKAFATDTVDLPAVHVVGVLIFNRSGQVLLQKRSLEKRHNPGLIDKSIGGHIVFGDSANYTVMLETVQELLTPSIVLRNETDFGKTLEIMKDYLTTVSIVEHQDKRELTFAKKVNGSEHMVANVLHLYFGVYDGSVKPADNEAAGVLFYNLDDLHKELGANSAIFTNDLKVILSQYNQQIETFIKKIQLS